MGVCVWATALSVSIKGGNVNFGSIFLSTYIDNHLHLVLEVLRVVRRVKRGYVKKHGGRFALVQAAKREEKES